MAERGKFVVFEGTDGSGKNTQIQPVIAHLETIGQPYKTIAFPIYGTYWGQEIKKYLAGEYGNSIPPLYRAMPYMFNRMEEEAAPRIRRWLDEGKLVIADRYAPSNRAFMAARLPWTKRKEFVDKLWHTEYVENGIPQEDLVILLKVPPKVSVVNVEKRGEGKDLHEKSSSYQRKVANMYMALTEWEPHWRVIDCMLTDTRMWPPEVISRRIIAVLEQEGIIPEYDPIRPGSRKGKYGLLD